MEKLHIWSCLLVSDMKGQIIAYGGTILMFVLASLVLIKVSATGDVSRTVITTEGKTISFVNYVEFTLKSFNTSIPFTTQRSAYELGKTAGLKRREVWTATYPSMDILIENLIEKMNENFPTYFEEMERKVSSDEAIIEIDYNDPSCNSLSNSICFFMEGEKHFAFFDDPINSIISVDSPIDTIIPSSYFNLLFVGREIVENNDYVSLSDNYPALLARLRSDFPNLEFTISARIVENGVDNLQITIEDRTCPTDYHCLVPMNANEPGITFGGENIPYDYLALSFDIEAEQS